ncbi:MAG: lipopolysaccharide biosynthesis protein, partial [Candidatus Omnitrophica bacterium]|nr:lipopolysaccharide biosynthesis protein [Candidatus Omnitrophota bacterium]
MEPELNERENTARDYMRGIFRRRGIIAATCAVTLVFVAIGLALKTKTYEAQVKMLIQAHKTIESPYYRNIADFR